MQKYTHQMDSSISSQISNHKPKLLRSINSQVYRLQTTTRALTLWLPASEWVLPLRMVVRMAHRLRYEVAQEPRKSTSNLQSSNCLPRWKHMEVTMVRTIAITIRLLALPLEVQATKDTVEVLSRTSSYYSNRTSIIIHRININRPQHCLQCLYRMQMYLCSKIPPHNPKCNKLLNPANSKFNNSNNNIM